MILLQSLLPATLVLKCFCGVLVTPILAMFAWRQLVASNDILREDVRILETRIGQPRGCLFCFLEFKKYIYKNFNYYFSWRKGLPYGGLCQ